MTTERSAIPCASRLESEADGRTVSNGRLNVLSDRDLLSIQKPAQYLGGELNSVMKSDADVDVHFALAFPDTYEVGMSHVGLQILYEILNSDARTWAERVYTPLADMEELLRSRSAVLTSLESQRPVRTFDVVGFSLQYELCGTNILTMLDLAGIPFYAADRTNDDPIIIGGGPVSYHPEALAPFFDAFFLGDAEEAISEVVDAVRLHKQQRAPQRADLLDALAKIEGIYIPSYFSPQTNDDGTLSQILPRDPSRPMVTRRLLPSMEGAPYVRKPIIPNIKTVHNRLSIEVMRGCVRGCRFCQAGYLYRPQRERSPEEILSMIEETLPASGYEELSLLSLSTADYCSVVPLLKNIMDRYGDGDKLAVSFPSTRVDALTPEVLEQVQRVRRTGFTIAPEGGTQRLRDVINKGVSDEQILETCKNVFSMGWSGIKLYFMLGLPTETDEDLSGIIEIASRIRRLEEAKGKDITVSVSTHVPKPHTPFQWSEQISPEETVRKQRLLADGLRRIRVNFRYHDSFSSFLEGVFCRAGRELAPAVVRAYELGTRLDAWQEHCREDAWMQAFTECNIDPFFYLRERATDEVLPWDHLSCGIPKSYFLKEYQRATRDKTTPDCLKHSCSICGACDYDQRKNVLWPRGESEQVLSQLAEERSATPADERSPADAPLLRVRFSYAKRGAYRFVGHLELATVFHRAARRASIPLCFTRGFHPMPRITFGPPIQLGIGSEQEYMDAFLYEAIDPNEIAARFNATLPHDVQILSATAVPVGAPALQESIAQQRYRLTCYSTPKGALAESLAAAGSLSAEAASKATEDLRQRIETLTVERSSEKRTGERGKRKVARSFPLKIYVSELHIEPFDQGARPTLTFTLQFDPQFATPRALEVSRAITGLDIGDLLLEKVATIFREPSGLMSRASIRAMSEGLQAR